MAKTRSFGTLLIGGGRNAGVTIVCGNEDCAGVVPWTSSVECYVPTGEHGMAVVDARPKSYNGARIGSPDHKRAFFPKMEKRRVCIGCSLKFKNTPGERRPDKTWRVR